jgi:hypothetical protein
LSTVANSKFGNTPWLNIESAGWLNIQSALTGMDRPSGLLSDLQDLRFSQESNQPKLRSSDPKASHCAHCRHADS